MSYLFQLAANKKKQVLKKIITKQLFLALLTAVKHEMVIKSKPMIVLPVLSSFFFIIIINYFIHAIS